MCRFLDYLIGKKATDSFTQKLQDAVDSAIAKKEWEVQYMTFAMKIREEKKKQPLRLLLKWQRNLMQTITG